MRFDPQKHHRRSIRIKEYDYTQPGGYFVTIVTYQRDLLFGEIIKEEMQLDGYGRIVDECWRAFPNILQMWNWVHMWSCPTMCMGLL